MALSFQVKGTVTISSNRTGSVNRISLGGISSADSITPVIAQNQMNKILDIVGVSISTDNMKRSVVEEAIDNE